MITKSIMDRELLTFTKRQDLNVDNINKHFEGIRSHVQDEIVKLHKNDVIDDKTLMHTVGVTCRNVTRSNEERSVYSRITGPSAKYFICNEPAYSYPLFKTHKLDESRLNEVGIEDLPTRLLQSAGHITTSRVTSFLESLLNPISKTLMNFVGIANHT